MDVDAILEDSISLFGDERKDTTTVLYGSITINVPPKESKALTLLADQLFSPTFALTELLEQGAIPCAGKNWLELGAGTGLVSIVAAASSQFPATVVITDYPDALILDNLKANVARNKNLLSRQCKVWVEGYAWGTKPDHLLTEPTRQGFDIVVMSDLLYFDKSHGILLESVQLLLSRTQDARLFVAAGKYTPPNVCQSFLREGEKMGLIWEEKMLKDCWEGTTVSGSYTVEELQARKNNSRLWIGRWK